MANFGHFNSPPPKDPIRYSPHRFEKFLASMMATRKYGSFTDDEISMIQSESREYLPDEMLMLLVKLESRLSSEPGDLDGNNDRYNYLKNHAESSKSVFFLSYFQLVNAKFASYVLNNQAAHQGSFPEWDLDLEEVAHRYYSALEKVSRSGNPIMYSAIARETAFLAAKSSDFETALVLVDTAIRNAPNKMIAAECIANSYQYHLNVENYRLASLSLKELGEINELDWTKDMQVFGQAQIDYLRGETESAIQDLLDFINGEGQKDAPSNIQRKAVSVLLRALCKTKEFNKALSLSSEFQKKRLLSFAIREFVKVHHQLAGNKAETISTKEARSLLSKLNRVQRLAKRDVHFQQEVSDLRMAVATKSKDLDIIKEELATARNLKNSRLASRNEFVAVVNNVGLTGSARRPDGLIEANRSVAELNNKVNLIIFGGVIAGAFLAIGVLVRLRLTSRKTQKSLVEEMNRREVEFEAKIERQIEAHSKVMLNQVEFNQKIELELERKRRTDVLGILTGGVAHDFNNLLFVIQQSTENIRSQYASSMDEEGISLLNEADKAISIGKEIVNCLLSYAREQKLSESVVNLSRFLGEINPLLKSISGKEIEIIIDCEDDELELFIDKGLLTTSIINLCVNSRDAMDGQGTIRVQCELSKRSSDVEIRVVDSGCGIEESKLESIFDPFYSSKESSPFTGNGIGLSMVQGFVTQSGGQIEIESIVGKGTTVIMSFPVNRPQNMIETAFQSADFTGRSVLLVDDNPMVRKTMYKTLEKLGFDVFMSDGFEESINCFKSELPIDLVVTDVQLSGKKSGKDLAKWIKFNHADTGVILISGGVLNEIPFGCQFLPKPFSTAQLVEQLNEVLSQKKKTAG